MRNNIIRSNKTYPFTRTPTGIRVNGYFSPHLCVLSFPERCMMNFDKTLALTQQICFIIIILHYSYSPYRLSSAADCGVTWFVRIRKYQTRSRIFLAGKEL